MCKQCTAGEIFEYARALDEAPPEASNATTSLDHERWMERVSAALIEQAKRYNTKNTAHLRLKAMDLAIKARRSALELTRWREDWEKTRKLELQVQRIFKD